MHHIKPIIRKQNEKQSLGKGFSRTEVAKAGLDKAKTRRLGLPVDDKRKSSNEENIKILKEHAEKAKALAKPKLAKPEEPKKKAKS